LEEICCKVMMEPEDAQDDTTYSPPSAEERATFGALVAASIQTPGTDGTSKEQPDKVLVWESAIPTAVVPVAEPPGLDHSTALDGAPLELTQVGGGLGGAAAPAAGVISTCSLAAPGGMPVEPPLPSQPAVLLAEGGQQPSAVVDATSTCHLVEGMHAPVLRNSSDALQPLLQQRLPASKPPAMTGNLVVDKILKPTTLRRSERAKSTADEHILQKVEKRAARKNLESPGKSFTSFSDSKIAENLGKIGINLGSSVDLVTSSIVTIKNLEVDRMIVHANNKKNKFKKNPNPWLAESDDEDDRLDAILGHVGGNLIENAGAQENDLILDLSPVDRKKKSSLAKNLKKGRSSKKPKTPSKIVLQ
jgi:hypothetical protein